MIEENLNCLDCNKTDVTVKWTTTPDRTDYQAFPRCPDCHEKRLLLALDILKRYPVRSHWQ
jgi:NAD-dependent SIR2 family protein deacetylase